MPYIDPSVLANTIENAKCKVGELSDKYINAVNAGTGCECALAELRMLVFMIKALECCGDDDTCGLTVEEILRMMESTMIDCAAPTCTSSVSSPVFPPLPAPFIVSLINVEENNVLRGSFSTLNFIGSGITDVTVTAAGGGQADILIDTTIFRKITRTNALAEIAAGTLKAGTTYWIYDVGDGLGHTDPNTAFAGVILRAASNDLFDSNGVFIARNINRTAVPTLWDYNTSYTIGQLVENFNGVFQATVITTNATLNPASNAAQWKFTGKIDSTVYTTEIQRCIYDISTDMILQRSDARGNVMTTYNSSGPSNNNIILKCFRWGYTNFKNNKININLSGIVDTATTLSTEPVTNNFKWNAVDGTVTNNIIDIVFSTNTCNSRTSSGINYTVTNVQINNNIIRNSEVAFSTNMRMFNNDFTQTVIRDNSYTLPGGVQFSHIFNNKGSFQITYNFSNTGAFSSNNDPLAPLKDTEIINCTGDPFLKNGQYINDISGNVGSRIEGCKLKEGKVSSNTNIHVYGCNLENSYIEYNVADGRSDSNRFISQVVLKEQSFIARNYFKSFQSLGINEYNQKILQGTLANRNSYISDQLFSVALNKNILLDGNPYTLKTANIQGFYLDNIHLDGTYAGVVNPAYSGIYSISGAVFPAYITSQVNNCYTPTASNSANNAYAFINMDDNTIFNSVTGVLTIPNYCTHAGTFILYTDMAVTYTINKVIINTSWTGTGGGIPTETVKYSYIGPWKFINGKSSTGNIVFTLTSVGVIGTDQIARTPSISSVTLTRSTEFFEIVKNGTYYTVNNIQTVV